VRVVAECLRVSYPNKRAPSLLSNRIDNALNLVMKAFESYTASSLRPGPLARPWTPSWTLSVPSYTSTTSARGATAARFLDDLGYPGYEPRSIRLGEHQRELGPTAQDHVRKTAFIIYCLYSGFVLGLTTNDVMYGWFRSGSGLLANCPHHSHPFGTNWEPFGCKVGGNGQLMCLKSQ